MQRIAVATSRTLESGPAVGIRPTSVLVALLAFPTCAGADAGTVPVESRPAVASPVGLWTLRTADGACDGLETASPEVHFTADGRFSFDSRRYSPGTGAQQDGCCAVRWARVGLYRATAGGLQLDPLSIPAELRGRVPVESAAIRDDGTLEVRLPETSCRLILERSASTPASRHAQTLERLRECTRIEVAKPGRGMPIGWGDVATVQLRVRSPAVLASGRAERHIVEPGSHTSWDTLEYAIVGQRVGAVLRMAACAELTLGDSVAPEELPQEPIVADVRILARATTSPR